MRTRDAVLDYQATQKDTATYTKDLDLTDPVSALAIEVECTNGSTSNEDNFISDIVTKIEVVDGSDVQVSLTLTQLEALHFYKTGKNPTLFPSEWASGIQRHQALLLFGRYLWDPLYGMDFTRYKNPQLKITFNKAAIRAASGTGFATGDNIKLTVVAKIMEELGAKPVKFLMQKEIDSFTLGASGEKRVELPTDYPYRLALLRAWLQGSDIDECVTQLKLTCDTDKFIALNRYVKQLDAEALAQFGFVGPFKHDIYRAHGATVRLLCNKEPAVSITEKAGVADIPCVNWEWSSQLYLSLFTHAGANDSTARQLTMKEFGHALHATVPIIFGRMNEPDTWFNATKYKKVEAVLTQGAAGAFSLVLEQERPLP